MHATTDRLWGIILAGGEGRRLQRFIRLHWGSKRPKQYCTLIGGQSMLRHTLARAERIIPPERLLTIVTRHHLGYAREELYDRPPASVIIQPCNRETGPGILLPLLHIHQRDPDAIVALLPSDHFIVEEERFMAAVEGAASFVTSSPRYLVLLGVEPHRPETEYGWIEAGDLLEHHWGGDLYRVKSFWEKPRVTTAKALYHNGCLWNTLVLVGQAWMLLMLFQTLTPELYVRLQRIRPVLGGRGEAEALKDIYGRLPSVNFSRAILARSAHCLGVLRVKGVYWSDWGNPEQVRMDVARFAPGSDHETSLSGNGLSLNAGRRP